MKLSRLKPRNAPKYAGPEFAGDLDNKGLFNWHETLPDGSTTQRPVARYEYVGITIFAEDIPSENRKYSPEIVAKIIDNLPKPLVGNIATIALRSGNAQDDEAASERYGFKMTSAADANYSSRHINIYNSKLLEGDLADIDEFGRDDKDDESYKKLFPILAHEAGHLADRRTTEKPGVQKELSNTSEYKKAIEADKKLYIEVSGRKIVKGDIFGGFVSEYARATYENHDWLGLKEDFADSVAEYVKFINGIDTSYEPLLKNRFAYFKKVFKDDSR